MSGENDWRIVCDRQTFEKCREDERFPYIVALARSTNALNSVHSFMLLVGEIEAPQQNRDRLNSYFFASAILYEIFKLIERMNQAFRDDEIFQNGLRLLIKDPAARNIRDVHLKPVRTNAVFHYLPEAFAETIEKSTCDECLFVTGRGPLKGNINYSFADVIAAEILVGFAEDSPEFYQTLSSAMEDTRTLVIKFVPAAEDLIKRHLERWGFKLEIGKPIGD